MSIFKAFTKPAAIVLTLAAMGAVSTAQAQQSNRMVVALAPTDAVAAPIAVAKPARVAVAPVATPRAKRIAQSYASMQKPANDCFWCGREVFISGLTY